MFLFLCCCNIFYSPRATVQSICCRISGWWSSFRWNASLFKVVRVKFLFCCIVQLWESSLFAGYVCGEACYGWMDRWWSWLLMNLASLKFMPDTGETWIFIVAGWSHDSQVFSSVSCGNPFAYTASLLHLGTYFCFQWIFINIYWLESSVFMRGALRVRTRLGDLEMVIPTKTNGSLKFLFVKPLCL